MEQTIDYKEYSRLKNLIFYVTSKYTTKEAHRGVVINCSRACRSALLDDNLHPKPELQNYNINQCIELLNAVYPDFVELSNMIDDIIKNKDSNYWDEIFNAQNLELLSIQHNIKFSNPEQAIVFVIKRMTKIRRRCIKICRDFCTNNNIEQYLRY